MLGETSSIALARAVGELGTKQDDKQPISAPACHFMFRCCNHHMTGEKPITFLYLRLSVFIFGLNSVVVNYWQPLIIGLVKFMSYYTVFRILAVPFLLLLLSL